MTHTHIHDTHTLRHDTHTDMTHTETDVQLSSEMCCVRNAQRCILLMLPRVSANVYLPMYLYLYLQLQLYMYLYLCCCNCNGELQLALLVLFLRSCVVLFGILISNCQLDLSTLDSSTTAERERREGKGGEPCHCSIFSPFLLLFFAAAPCCDCLHRSLNANFSTIFAYYDHQAGALESPLLPNVFWP